MFQAARVLKTSGYETIDEFLSNKDKLIQETNVFAYYILRSAHMYSLEEYLEWIEKNVIIGFKLRDNASDSYYELSMIFMIIITSRIFTLPFPSTSAI